MPEAERTRSIHQRWDRVPGGKSLNQYDAPRGKRTPNGAVWGHSTDDLFIIQRIPDADVVTCWSRSMIKEFGERPIDDGNEPHEPRVRRPYPLLKIDKDVECPESGMYDHFDEGSEHGDPIPVKDPEDAKGKEEEKRMNSGDTKAKAEEAEDQMPVESPPTDPKQDYIYQGKGGYIHRRLEEHIPQQFFPDQLIVTDPFGLAFGEEKIPRRDGEPERKPWTYKRLYPSFSHDWSTDPSPEDPVTAELYLDPDEVIGVGHHSNVYRATLTLPKGLSARTPDGKVTVVAKTAFPHSEHRSMFDHEAKIFSSFQRHLSEEWCGYNMVSPLAWPVPVGPVVPKFYGYYVPVGKKRDSLSPILLMEECGTPVDPRKLTPEQKTECYSLYLRFHSAGYLHQSTYTRNVVMQPGPLTRHPQERSWSTPSFRLIDFGRSINVKEKVAKVKYLKFGLTVEEMDIEKGKVYHYWHADKAREERAINIEFEIGCGLITLGDMAALTSSF
ncbi:hypothetical protein BDM02DRAFT_3186476 [Thelephora ganbajun]|uniref:Uncharacterized protein n=1 Tax=Thelephora ganbajun TaxID=370292 RepID=A0ACB6ZHW4_THEGA|nr:hypothetical protein BDM02DRAFT_3186476 [Thelephora ganbajun]